MMKLVMDMLSFLLVGQLLHKASAATVELAVTESVSEGGMVDVTVSLATNGTSLAEDVTVTMSTALDMSGSNPASESDFTPLLSIEKVFQTGGDMIAVVTVSATEDSIAEGNETFLLRIDAVTGPAMADSAASTLITITDNNVLELIFDTESSADEGIESRFSDTYDVCVKAVGDATSLQNSVTVTFAIEENTEDIDQPLPVAMLTDSSQLRACITFRIENDDLVEGPEELTFTIDQISPSLGITIGDPDTFVFLIGDNDGGIIISFLNTAVTVMEGDGVINVCIELLISSDKTLGTDIWLPLTTSDIGTANTGVDFTILASSVRFLEGSSPGHTECISVMIIDDDDYEGDQTFTVIRNILILMPSIASISGHVVITVRDNADAVVAMTHERLTVTESAGTVDICVNPGIHGNIERILVVGLQANNGEARIEEDFTKPALLIVAFTTQTTPQCATFDILDDDLLEGDHAFTVEIIDAGDAVLDSRSSSTIITIVDDERGVLVFPTSRSSVREGSIATDVCISVSAGSPPASALANNLIIFLTTVPGEAGVDDFSNGTYDVIFEMGAPFPLEGCVEIPTLQDDVIEGYEYFTVSVSGTSPNDAVTISESSTHVITIVDDDVTLLSVQSGSSSIREDIGTVSVCVKLYTVQMEELETDVAIDLTVDDITTVAGEDLNVTSPTTELTFSSGVSDGHSECVQINIIDDDVYEENQQFLVSITRVSTSLPLLAVEELANVYTLEDNGDAEVRFVMEEYSVMEESGFVAVCVELVAGGFEANLTLNLSAQDGIASVTDDISLPDPFQVVFSVGQNSSTSCTSIPVTSDERIEGDEYFTVSIATAESALYRVAENTSLVSITISDDDVASIGIQSGISSISEDVGTINVCVEINGLETQELETDIIVDLNVEDITTVQGEDFIVTSPTTQLTFSSGVSDGHSECVQINIIDDDVYEEEQQFDVCINTSVLPMPANVTSYCNTYRLEDNTDAEVRFVMEDYTVIEDSGSVSVCVETGALGGFETALTVNLTAQDGTASLSDDISLPDPFRVVFSVGQNTSTGCITIPITRDEEFEEDHYFTVSITSAGTVPYALVGSPAVARVTILDDDGINEGCDSVNMPLVIAIATGSGVVLTITAFLLGVCLHRVFIKYTCYCKKRPQEPPPDPYYADIVLNSDVVLVELQNADDSSNSASNGREDIVTSQNEAYSGVQGTPTIV